MPFAFTVNLSFIAVSDSRHGDLPGKQEGTYRDRNIILLVFLFLLYNIDVCLKEDF